MTCGMPSITTVWPRRNRRVGKSVTTRHLSSPRMPWAPRTWATIRKSGGALDDVEVDAALSADDFADVLFVDFQLVDRGIAIRDLVDLDRVWLIDERSCHVFDQP